MPDLWDENELQWVQQLWCLRKRIRPGISSGRHKKAPVAPGEQLRPKSRFYTARAHFSITPAPCIKFCRIISQMVSSGVGCSSATIISRICLECGPARFGLLWTGCPACIRTNRPACPVRRGGNQEHGIVPVPGKGGGCYFHNGSPLLSGHDSVRCLELVAFWLMVITHHQILL